MSKRDLAKKYNSLLEQYKVWRKGEGQSSSDGGIDGNTGGIRGPVLSPEFIGPGGPGFGGGGRGSSAKKPKVSIEKARELGIVKSEPKVWRRGSNEKSSNAPTSAGKSAEQKPMYAGPSPRTDIPGATEKQKKWSRRGSAAVHGAAAAALIYGLKKDAEQEKPGGADPASDSAGVTWIDTKDIVDRPLDQTPAPSPEPEIQQEPDIALEPAIKPTPDAPVTIKPATDQPAAQPKAITTGSAKNVSSTQPVPVTTSDTGATASVSGQGAAGDQQTGPGAGAGKDNSYSYRPSKEKLMVDLPEHDQSARALELKLSEQYKNFDQQETAKEKFLKRVIGPESGGISWIKNPYSSATGLFQFIEPTWKSVVAKAKPGDPHYGVSFQEMPGNVAAQRAAAKQIADEYSKTIRRTGLPDVPTSYYLLHGHGPKAVEIYKNPEKQLKDIYPEYVKNKRGETVKNIVYRQNPNFNPNQRLGDFVAARAKQMGDRITDVFPGATAGELPKPTTVATRKTPALKAVSEPARSVSTPSTEKSSDTVIDKIKKVLPPFLGGKGELASKAFAPTKSADAKKSSDSIPKTPTPSTASITPVIEPVAKKDKVDLQKDQVGLVKAKRELSDFERAFAAARAEKGAGQTFDWTNPRTGKTSTYTTSYRSEPAIPKSEKTSSVGTLISKLPADKVEPTKSTTEPIGQLYKGIKNLDQSTDVEKITQTIDNKLTGPVASAPAEKSKSDELWKDIRQDWNALSSDEQAARVKDAKAWLYGDDAQASSDLKESINTESNADLHDILKLAGRRI